MKRFYKKIEVLRSLPGSYVKGQWVNGGVESIEVLGLVQRLKNLGQIKDVNGRTITGGIVIYSTQELQIGKGDAVADQVKFNGDTYEVANSYSYSRVKGRYRSEAYFYDDEGKVVS